MDIEELLHQKKKKLEELKKQRLAKQQEIVSSSTSTENEANSYNNSKSEDGGTVDDVSPNLDEEERNTIEDVAATASSRHAALKDPLPRLLYTKNTETMDLYSDTTSNLETLKEDMKRDLERKIRKELNEKYKRNFDSAVKTFLESKSSESKESKPSREGKESEQLITIEYPTTKVKGIEISGSETNSILTLHDDCVCVWKRKEFEFTLCDRIPLYTKTNIAIFDTGNSQRIITGSESGYIHIYDISNNSQIRSKVQLDSIVSMYQSSGSLIVLTLNGSYTVLAMNLVDVLSPLVCIFMSPEFKSNSDSPIQHENIVISACEFINANNVVIALLTGEVVSVDFGQRKTTIIFNEPATSEKLPIISLSYNSGKLILLGLDHTVKIVSVTTGLNLFETIELPDLSFSVDWLSPSLFVSCSIQNAFTIWSIQNDKILKLKTITVDTTTTDKLSLISSIQALDPNTLAVGDLSGKFYIVNVNL